MKYMLIMRATDAAKEAFAALRFDEVITRMGKHNEAMTEAGVLLSGGWLGRRR